MFNPSTDEIINESKMFSASINRLKFIYVNIFNICNFILGVGSFDCGFWEWKYN